MVGRLSLRVPSKITFEFTQVSVRSHAPCLDALDDSNSGANSIHTCEIDIRLTQISWAECRAGFCSSTRLWMASTRFQKLSFRSCPFLWMQTQLASLMRSRPRSSYSRRVCQSLRDSSRFTITTPLTFLLKTNPQSIKALIKTSSCKQVSQAMVNWTRLRHRKILERRLTSLSKEKLPAALTLYKQRRRWTTSEVSFNPKWI